MYYAWQALLREKKTRNWLVRNFSQEIRCKKCEKFMGISLSIFTHFLNQIDQLFTPKKRRSSHPLHYATIFKTFGIEESREFLCTLQKPTMFFVCIFGMLSFIFGPILNILPTIKSASLSLHFHFSFFSEISQKNQNMAEASCHVCRRMFKIGPNMNDTIPMIQKKIITCL